MKKIFILVLCLSATLGCKKDRYEFTLKAVKLNSFHKKHHFSENLFIKIVEPSDTTSVLATTDIYPGNITLPATYAVHPGLLRHLYVNPVTLQLWGDSSGFISSNTLDMKEYKIIYPIDMEVENEEVSFSLLGSWK